MNSRLYECHVMHARFIPKPHRFAYRIFMLAVDLDELPALDSRLRLFSVNRGNLYAFRENDYLPTSESIYNQSPSQVCHLIGDKLGSVAPMPPAAQPEPVPSASASARARARAQAQRLAPASTPNPMPVPAPTGLTAPSLKTRVLAFLATRGVDLGPGGRVELVTLPRVFGYLFNPVSFYYCYDVAGTCVASIAEVTNTFREMKPYFLGPENRRPGASGDTRPAFHLRTPKHFYVSPFSDVDVAFDFTLRAPIQNLSVQIDDYVGDQRTLTSTLTGPVRPLTDATLAWFTLKYPLITLKIIALIHWHALRLYVKKIPWFPKTNRPSDQRDLYRPHSSLTPSRPPDA